MILGGCIASHEKTRDAIAVSFEPQAWMARQIAGEDVEVITLLPAGSDPETYQPSVSIMKNLGDAAVYFTLGTGGFEQSLTDNIKKNFPGLKISDSASDIEKIYDSHGNIYHEEHSDSFDPHILASIKNCVKIADSMEKTLISMYPEKKAIFKSNGEKLKRQLAALDDSITRMNLRGKPFVIRHPSLEYYARDYGIKQIALNDAGKETSPKQLKERIDEAAESKPEVMVVEKEHEYSSDSDIARQLSVDTIKVSLNSISWLEDLMRISHEIDRD